MIQWKRLHLDLLVGCGITLDAQGNQETLSCNLSPSRLPGFFLPLSGGADSAATCTLVGVMCKLIVKSINEGNECVLSDVRRIAGYGKDERPKSAEELCSKIFVTCYMGTTNSSEETRDRAALLAKQVKKKKLVDVLTQIGRKPPHQP